MAMLKFHNAVIDFLIIDNFSGDLFVEAKIGYPTLPMGFGT